MYPRDKEDDLINDLKFQSVREFLNNFLRENNLSIPNSSDFYDLQYILTRALDEYNNDIYDSMNCDELRELDFIKLNLNDFEQTKELLIHNINNFNYEHFQNKFILTTNNNNN